MIESASVSDNLPVPQLQAIGPFSYLQSHNPHLTIIYMLVRTRLSYWNTQRRCNMTVLLGSSQNNWCILSNYPSTNLSQAPLGDQKLTR